MAERLTLPGFVNAHSHGFQRALRGRTEGGDFWAWRESMLDVARYLGTEQVRESYVDVYRELLGAGYTAVGEFHYLGFDEAVAAAEAAEEAAITFVLLYAAYARGGLERFRQESVDDYLRQLERLRERGLMVGVAPHSVRACPVAWLRDLAAYAEQERLPLHVHADEQPREIEECLAETGLRPIELLSEAGCLGPRTTVVHATHADEHELDLIAAAGARVCLCPTTEANLGDGFAPVEQLCERGIGICIGSDSNVRIDPLEELRELEGIARRRTGRRNVVSPDSLLCFGADEGAASLGIESWPEIAIDLDHRALRGVAEANLGDGFAPVEQLCERGIGICIGSDSNVRIDPLEELRELEGIARRRTGRRNVVSPDSLLCFGADEGAASLGIETWPEIAIDLDHRALRGVAEEDVFTALVFGCSSDVVAPIA